MEIFDNIVIGAGQAGLSTSFHLSRLGINHVVLDANDHPGGAWQHRWESLTMRDVHGVAALPDMAVPDLTGSAPAGGEPAREFMADYFDEYEQRFALSVLRPVRVSGVESTGELLRVTADSGSWLTRTIVNATGTWGQPFIPYYPGVEKFRGRQLHTVDYTSPEDFAGKRVLVVGAGGSAIQLLGEIAPLAAATVWATRRPPVWRTEPFDADVGRAAVALVEERVRQGLPPQSIVSVTGSILREQEQAAKDLGAYDRRPMFEHLEADGARWADSSTGSGKAVFEPLDAIIWATGFRPVISHLAPLHLRGPHGGIQLERTTAVVDPRVQLVGYGPSASTIGANRGGRVAAVAVKEYLASQLPVS
ncbi:MAG: NAD(P)/FAD-dependent oxidoreductase [Kineosporiaceae bacterium]|nr:NAD(P)/FAD-dependent oxidoreductase [Aeromicrobium sp.]